MNQTRILSLCTWLAFLLFSVVMCFAARGDLWLDEIWSLAFAQNAESIADVFVRFQHDNNHPLNTLFLYFVGKQTDLVVYRLLSVLAGIGSMLLAGYIARRDWGHWEALFSTVLIGSAYPLLLYFTEARGYAPAMFLGLAAYATLVQPRERISWKQLALFWSASVLGILAHATFVMLSLAFAMWSAVREVETRERYGLAARRLLVLHAPPLLFFTWWYLFFLKDAVIGGGEEYGKWSVIGQASALIFGLPDVPAIRSMAPFLCLLVVALGSAALYRQRDIRWSFFPAAIVISPALMILVANPTYLYFRYFAVCFPFVMLLCAYLLGSCCRSSSRTWRWLACSALAVFLAGQVPRDFQLLRLGRGQYTAALEFIVAESPDRYILVGSDHDFRNQRLLDFYARRVTRGSDFRYVEQPQFQNAPPDWLIEHSQDVSHQPAKEFILKGVGTYRLTKEYRFSGISGWSWFIFRRDR